MATTDAVTVLNRAAKLLSDQGHVSWTMQDLLDHLNDAQLSLAIHVPNAASAQTVIALAAGVAQQVPSDAIRIIEFLYNTNAAGTSIGRAVRQVERKVLQDYAPNWAQDAANITVQQIMYNAEDNSSVFYVYPQQPSTPGYLAVNYAKTPAVIPNFNAGTKITAPDYYFNALVYYVVFRAFITDTDAGNFQRGGAYYQYFMDEIGVKAQGDLNPNNDKPA